MAEYAVRSFDNTYYGKTNIHITDTYKVENEMPTDFYYHISVTGGREKPSSSDYPYAVVLDYSILTNGHMGNIDKECAFIINEAGASEYFSTSLLVQHNMSYTYTENVREAYGETENTYTESVNRTDFPYSQTNLAMQTSGDLFPWNFDIEFSTNMPIFETSEEIEEYKSLSGNERITYLTEHCLNYGDIPPDVDDSTNDYYIYNRYQNSSVERGVVSVNETTIHQANERILYNGSDICLYRDSSNPFMLSIKKGSGLVASIYSNTSINEVSSASYDEFTFDSLEYSSPFYSSYSYDFGVTSYEGYLAIGLSTNLPIWDNETDANDYINGTKDITESSNWDKISTDPVFSNIITNLTGLPEVVTEFGESYVRNIFSQIYLCNTAALYEISNNLFDYDVTTLSGVWDDIKKGLEMYGSNPMECVQGLRYYPFDLSTIFSSIQSQDYVYFGAYKLELQNSSVYKIIYGNGYLDLGTVSIRRTFKDWRDFEPYTKLSIYLPYVGKYQLDLNKYYDKNINVRYYIDLRTGACCACLIANGVLLDWFDGLIGTEMPITLTDYSSYAQNQINIIMRNAGIGIAGEGAVGSLGVKGLNSAMNYSAGQQGAAFANTYVAQGGGNAAFSAAQSASASAGAAGAAGIAGTAALGAAAMGVVALGVAEKTAFDLMRTGTAAYTKGRPGSSSMLNQFLPQYPTFMFEIMEIDESPYLNELYGRPSNTSGTIGSFSGYLEAEDVMLICPIATDNERQEIIDLVKSGIYI